MEVCNYDIGTVGYIYKAGALFVFVGAFGVPGAAQPECLPCLEAVAVDGAGAAHGEAVQAVRVDQCGKVLACLALNTGLADHVVGYIVAALEHSALCDVEVDTLAEKQRACQIGSGGHHNNSAAVLCHSVDQMLDLCRVNLAVIKDIVLGENVLPAEFSERRYMCVVKPFVNRCPVREKFLCFVHNCPPLSL